MFKCVKLLVILVVLSLCENEAARILAVFPTPSISHQVVFRSLVQELAKRGHEVVTITTDPAFPKGQAPKNLTEIDVHDLSYKLWQDFLKTSTGKQTDTYDQMKKGFRTMTKVFFRQIETNEVKKAVKEGNYDLLLVEALSRPALIFSHIFKLPVIQVSSLGATLGNHDLLGGPTHPLLYPIIMRQKIYNLTLWEKITELKNHYYFMRMSDETELEENAMLKEAFGPDVPTVAELKDNVDLLFLNVNPLFDSNRPVPPNVIYLGGMHQKPEKELPKDLKDYLDNSKNGVIYISFGTNVKPSFLPEDRIRVLTSVFSKMPYDVLWKWDKDELPGRTANIKISKWLPQSDLLRHPKIKVFITQGGLQSTDEAISAGVPLIGMPMLADQWFNVEHYKKYKIGLRLDMEFLTEDAFREALYTVINDESYRMNVIRLRTLMQDQPQPPMERAIWWVEYVLRNKGAKHLRTTSFNVSWAEYLELELVFILLSAVTISLSVLAVILKYVIKFVFRKNDVVGKKKNN